MATPPSAPIITLAPRASNQTLEFKWSAPTSAGSGPITGYSIEIRGLDGGLALGAGVDGNTFYYKNSSPNFLTNGILYTTTIRATNDGTNYGPVATFRSFSPGNGVPAIPQTATATAGSGYTSAVVSWTAPASTPDSPIFWYTIVSSSSNPSDPVIKRTANGLTQTSLLITGLNPASNYTFNVQAVNCPGYGPALTTNSVGPPVAANGSVSFDVGDYFSMSPGITIGSGDYSVDGWVYFPTTPVIFNNKFILGGSAAPTYLFISIGNQPGVGVINIGTVISSQSFTVSSLSSGTWYYFAAARQSNNITVWLGTTPGGTATRSATGTLADSNTYGGLNDRINYTGGSSTEITMTNLRIQIGASLFTVSNSTIPIPSINTSADANTKLLLLETSAENLTTDSSGTQTLNATGTPTWSSSTPYP